MSKAMDLNAVETAFTLYLEKQYYQALAKNVAHIVITRRKVVWSIKEEKLCKGDFYNPLDYTYLRDFLSEIDKIENGKPVIFRDTLEHYALGDLEQEKETLITHWLTSWQTENKDIQLTTLEVTTLLYTTFTTWLVKKQNAIKLSSQEIVFWPLYTDGCKLLGIKVKDTNMLDSQSDIDTVQAIETAYLECFKRNPMPQHKVKPFKVIEIRKDLKAEIEKQLAMQVYSEGIGLNTYLKKSKQLIHRYLSYNKYLKAHPELKCQLATTELDNLCVQLIHRIALIEGYQYTIYASKYAVLPTAKQVLTYNKCKIEAFMYDIIHAYRKGYIEEHTRQSIMKKMPKNPKNNYPRARAIHRHFIIHYGDTNTGKTYNALNALKEARTGTYLAPLRLLALEVQEKMLDAGVLCDLRTGEEELLFEGATHSSCTVEKANLNQRYDVCVIDECQLVDEVQRGWAWTRAILGIQANIIYLCVAREGVDILKTMIEDCGDSYELVEHTRETALQIENKDFIFPLDVKKADAIVCFSKKHVLKLAAELSDLGIKPSILYGALPYSTRKKQIERFVNGETDVVVCTDCIGMGVNLAIKRVVFLENTKFDGIEKRELTAPEIKQIAGRAGRRNMYKYGYVAAQSNRKQIAKAIKCVVPQIETARLGFEDDLVNIEADILDILKVWQSLPNTSCYIKTNLDRTIELVDTLIQMNIKLEKPKLLALANIPFDERIADVLDLWKSYAKSYYDGCETLEKPLLNLTRHNTLEALENYYKCLDMYYAFSKSFQLPFDHVWLTKEKEQIADRINNILVGNMTQSKRKCKKCSTQLPWDFPYTLCDDCYYTLHFCKEE